MKKLADAAAKAAKQREWHWCRRRNGFSDMPIWRRVAARLELPLFQVLALVNRLEELANEAGNRGFARGEVGHFSAEEFGHALGMAEADAARIFEELQHPAVGWVAYGVVSDFYERNRDKEDDTAPLRQRRLRARRSVLTSLAQLARGGLIAAAARSEIEVRLTAIADAELFALQAELALALSTGACVTRDARRQADAVDNSAAAGRAVDNGVETGQPPGLSTAACVTRDARRDARSDIVTVTLEKRRGVADGAVDNSGAVDNGAAAGQPGQESQGGSDPQAEALAWLQSTGVKIITQRLDEPRPLAATRIERWLQQKLGGDAVALRAIIEAARATDLTVARFLTAVSDGVERARRAEQTALPLGPVEIKRAAGG